jgi:hypothetical protein
MGFLINKRKLNVRKYFYFVSTLFAFGLVSCEDFFSTTLTLEDPPYESRLVIKGIAYSGEDTMLINVSKSIGVLENDSLLKVLEGVDIDAKLNNTFVDVEEKKYYGITTYKLRFGHKLRAGDQLSINAQYKDYPIASTIEIMPQDIVLSDVKVNVEKGVGIFEDSILKTRFEISSIEDIYFSVYHVDTFRICRDFDTITFDCILFENFINKAYHTINDVNTVNDRFGKKSKDPMKKLFTSDSYKSNEKGIPHIYIDQISKNTYDHLISKDLYFENNDNPFGTPVNVKSNVINGYGNISLINRIRIN